MEKETTVTPPSRPRTAPLDQIKGKLRTPQHWVSAAVAELTGRWHTAPTGGTAARHSLSGVGEKRLHVPRSCLERAFNRLSPPSFNPALPPHPPPQSQKTPLFPGRKDLFLPHLEHHVGGGAVSQLRSNQHPHKLKRRHQQTLGLHFAW